ncbi:ATP-binding protein [Sphingopyxis sp. R3-92]|uniref:ATP-binding protein n=1 Tax=Sphingopyxis sp. R3-92 TaxID=3158553 RepID=UPI003EE62F78
MTSIDIAPTAAALLGSLRGLGYTPETALADLIDNSIAADATVIELSIDWNRGSPRITVRDDGRGMSRTELLEAMRFGGMGPNCVRSPGDLGRFGLGLKTASLSQCRRLTVASARDGQLSRLTWDLETVERENSWTVLVGGDLPPFDHVRAIGADDTGTMLILDEMDEAGGFHGLDEERFFSRLADVRAHFAMVFHRFLNGDARRVRIVVNGRDVAGWDPMQRTHEATQNLGSTTVGRASARVSVTSYVLPHRDRYRNEADFMAAGGPGGWAERQGFYIYRGKRLVVAGSWLGLGERREWTKDESSRLARIALDLPTSSDLAWRINVIKARARPPATLRNYLVKIGLTSRERAREVFAWRGGQTRGPVQRNEVSPIWDEEHASGRRRYRVNRDHPLLAALFERGGEVAKMTAAAVTLIERSVPVERIWLDVSEDVEHAATDADANAALIDDLVTAVRKAGSASEPEETIDSLLRAMRIVSPGVRSAAVAALRAQS